MAHAEIPWAITGIRSEEHLLAALMCTSMQLCGCLHLSGMAATTRVMLVVIVMPIAWEQRAYGVI